VLGDEFGYIVDVAVENHPTAVFGSVLGDCVVVGTIRLGVVVGYECSGVPTFVVSVHFAHLVGFQCYGGLREGKTAVLKTRLAEEESDDKKWIVAILVPSGRRCMRVNSRRLQPFGVIFSVADVPKSNAENDSEALEWSAIS